MFCNGESIAIDINDMSISWAIIIIIMCLPSRPVDSDLPHDLIARW